LDLQNKTKDEIKDEIKIPFLLQKLCYVEESKVVGPGQIVDVGHTHKKGRYSFVEKSDVKS